MSSITELSNKRLRVKTPYNTEIVELFRAMATAFWEPEHKSWNIPDSCVLQITNLLQELDMNYCYAKDIPDVKYHHSHSPSVIEISCPYDDRFVSLMRKIENTPFSRETKRYTLAQKDFEQFAELMFENFDANIAETLYKLNEALHTPSGERVILQAIENQKRQTLKSGKKSRFSI